MSSDLPSSDLLRDLENRQDEVLAQLDALNARIEAVIAEFRPAPETPAVETPAHREAA